MKIIDLKAALIGENVTVRVVTDAGIDGYGQAENTKQYLKPMVMFYKKYIIGSDPTDVERVMIKIRRLGSFKPWGAAVSAIEMALWDIAGKAAGVPVYKLLGGKVRDQVRCYNGGVRFKMNAFEPADYAENMKQMMASPEGFSIIKQGIAFHSPMPDRIDNFSYSSPISGPPHPHRGLMTEKGVNHVIACVEAMKSVMGDKVGLALDCGPGWAPSDLLRVAKALEKHHIMWMEDAITGDYVPYVNADVYRDISRATSTPIHTGEQIYLRQNFKELIETHAVSVIGPDPADIGGIAELKWVAEYADLHGISMAPHGVFDGVFGLAALVHCCAAMPHNFIAFEYPVARPTWWYDIVNGLPHPIVKNSMIDVWDLPGLGVTFDIDKASKYLPEDEKDFFE